ncbi:hypothetical protein DFH08DRAFT_965092 [Mycena albidolilacea]|uniref:DUF6533 domain-containing protein n=1 Tax=Mycena albidolilacea TaxID=1033008 RepID=A0AAD6ZRU4_9AGAR|nr:hypothetical protein DFH08DRAFT_965092 [Mycena albidolilacea]
MDPITPDVIQLAEDLLAHKWYFAGIFALIFFDFFLTLADEVQFIWKGKKGTVFYLFLMNRYCPMAFAIITLFGKLFSSMIYRGARSWWGRCNRFAIVEWLQTLLIVVPAEVVLLLRIYALTNANKYLLGFLVSIILTEFIIVFYAMSLPGTNNALVLPHVPIDSFRVCILFSDTKMDTAYLSTSIAFDCIVLAITLISTAVKNASQGTRYWNILRTIRWDGTMYFCVILSGNVVWMSLAMNARPGLKFMNAQPSMYLTSIMINRLTLSVRKAAAESEEKESAIEFSNRILNSRAADTATSHVIPTFA